MSFTLPGGAELEAENAVALVADIVEWLQERDTKAADEVIATLVERSFDADGDEIAIPLRRPLGPKDGPANARVTTVTVSAATGKQILLTREKAKGDEAVFGLKMMLAMTGLTLGDIEALHSKDFARVEAAVRHFLS